MPSVVIEIETRVRVVDMAEIWAGVLRDSLKIRGGWVYEWPALVTVKDRPVAVRVAVAVAPVPPPPINWIIGGAV